MALPRGVQPRPLFMNREHAVELNRLVGEAGLEPATFCIRSRPSDQTDLLAVGGVPAGIRTQDSSVMSQERWPLRHRNDWWILPGLNRAPPG